jgi:hypothetical protein
MNFIDLFIAKFIMELAIGTFFTSLYLIFYTWMSVLIEIENFKSKRKCDFKFLFWFIAATLTSCSIFAKCLHYIVTA